MQINKITFHLKLEKKKKPKLKPKQAKGRES